MSPIAALFFGGRVNARIQNIHGMTTLQTGKYYTIVIAINVGHQQDRRVTDEWGTNLCKTNRKQERNFTERPIMTPLSLFLY